MSHAKPTGPAVEAALVDQAIEDILALCAIPSPTGNSEPAASWVEARLRGFGLSPTRGPKGTVYCELGGTGSPLVLASHLDTLGAMVRSIKPNGRLRYTKIGGYPDLYLTGETCLIQGREGQTWTGTFQPVDASAHVNLKLKDLVPSEENMEVLVDEPVATAAETRKLGIAPGDFISIDARPRLSPSGYLKSRHLDDKASSGILLALASELAAGRLSLGRRCTLLFSTWEEVGHGGSVVPPGSEEFIAVDMGAVGEDLGCTDRMVSIAAKDSSGPYDRSVVLALEAAARRANCAFAVDIYPSYGSDAGAALRAGGDLRHGCLGPGVYASHGYERTHREAVASTLALLIEYLRSAPSAS
jgi:putative aminopeptidase FrvX